MKRTKPKKLPDTPEKRHARFIEADGSPDALDKAFKKLDTRAIRKDRPVDRASSISG
jgi:hypothetical protein